MHEQYFFFPAQKNLCDITIHALKKKIKIKIKIKKKKKKPENANVGLDPHLLMFFLPTLTASLLINLLLIYFKLKSLDHGC